MNVYPLLTEVRLSVAFTASVDSPGPMDPTDVAVTVTRPDGTTVADAVVVHDGTGQYHCDIAPDAVGIWRYRWQGTGVLVAASPTVLFRVN